MDFNLTLIQSQPDFYLSPSPNPQDLDSPIIYSSSPSEAPFVVALPASLPRRATPFKHKAAAKISNTPGSIKFPTHNPFAILDPSLFNSIVLPTLPIPPSLPTSSFSNQLVSDPDGSLLPQGEKPVKSL